MNKEIRAKMIKVLSESILNSFTISEISKFSKIDDSKDGFLHKCGEYICTNCNSFDCPCADSMGMERSKESVERFINNLF